MVHLNSDKFSEEILDELRGTKYACSSLTALSGGNANFIFRGVLQKPLEDGTTEVAIKHGQGYVASNPDFKITTDRCVRPRLHPLIPPQVDWSPAHRRGKPPGAQQHAPLRGNLRCSHAQAILLQPRHQHSSTGVSAQCHRPQELRPQALCLERPGQEAALSGTRPQSRRLAQQVSLVDHAPRADRHPKDSQIQQHHAGHQALHELPQPAVAGRRLPLDPRRRQGRLRRGHRDGHPGARPPRSPRHPRRFLDRKASPPEIVPNLTPHANPRTASSSATCRSKRERRCPPSSATGRCASSACGRSTWGR